MTLNIDGIYHDDHWPHDVTKTVTGVIRYDPYTSCVWLDTFEGPFLVSLKAWNRLRELAQTEDLTSPLQNWSGTLCRAVIVNDAATDLTFLIDGKAVPEVAE